MPSPIEVSITLNTLQTLIAHHEALPAQQRQGMQSAINTFARVCGRTPAEIVAEPAAIRRLAKDAAWQLAGLSKGSWSNVISRLRKAMLLAGIAVHRQRRNFRPTAGWEDLLMPMTRRDRDDLHRFAGWCSIHSITPPDVTAETFIRFQAYLNDCMIQRNPRERGHVARRAWNRAVARPGSPFPPILAPEPIGFRAVRWDSFPAQLQEEIATYRQRMLTADIFDDRHRAISPITVKNYETRLRVYLTGLIESGIAPEHFSSLARLVEIPTVKRGLEVRLRGGQLDDQARADLHSIAVAVLSVANFVRVDEVHLKELRRLAKRVRPRLRGMNAKNKARLAPLRNKKIALRLISLPPRIAHHLGSVTKPTIRQAQQMQMACLLEILLQVPMRIRNVAELDLQKNIMRLPGGQPGSWRISIPAEDVKNGVAIHAQLVEESSAMLDRYVRVFRPILAGQTSTALFLSQSGRAKGASALSKQLAGFVCRETGLTIHAHLMRHLAAHLYLDHNPGHYEDVRQILGHTQHNTTVNFYAGMEAEAAFARFDAIITGMRDNIFLNKPMTKISRALDQEDVL